MEKCEYTPLIVLDIGETDTAIKFKLLLFTIHSVILHFRLHTCIVGPTSKGFIRSAMKEWSSKTCLRFRNKTEADDDYVEFVYEGGYVLAKISSERQYQKKKSTYICCNGCS